jgi:hypothetical protein
VRKGHHGAILRDDDVDKMQVARDAPQLLENPPRDQQHRQARRPRSGDGVAHRRVEHVIARDRAIVVERERGNVHGTPPSAVAHTTCIWRK